MKLLLGLLFITSAAWPTHAADLAVKNARALEKARQQVSDRAKIQELRGEMMSDVEEILNLTANTRDHFANPEDRIASIADRLESVFSESTSFVELRHKAFLDLLAEEAQKIKINAEATPTMLDHAIYRTSAQILVAREERLEDIFLVANLVATETYVDKQRSADIGEKLMLRTAFTTPLLLLPFLILKTYTVFGGEHFGPWMGVTIATAIPFIITFWRRMDSEPLSAQWITNTIHERRRNAIRDELLLYFASRLEENLGAKLPRAVRRSLKKGAITAATSAFCSLQLATGTQRIYIPTRVQIDETGNEHEIAEPIPDEIPEKKARRHR